MSKYPIRMGIHSRLRNVISKSGGYDRGYATITLMKEYNLPYNVAYEMSINPNVRDEVEAVGLEAVVDLAKEKLRRRAIEFNSVTKMLIDNIDNLKGGY